VCRGRAQLQDGLDLRGAVHRVRHLREGAPPAAAGPGRAPLRACGGVTGRARRAAQKCPFDAIMIINLPKNLEKETTHRYGPNSFKLHRRGAAPGPPVRPCSAPAGREPDPLAAAAAAPGYRYPGQRRCSGWWAQTVRPAAPRLRAP
jgi:hypothetical protein